MVTCLNGTERENCMEPKQLLNGGSDKKSYIFEYSNYYEQHGFMCESKYFWKQLS